LKKPGSTGEHAVKAILVATVTSLSAMALPEIEDAKMEGYALVPMIVIVGMEEAAIV